MDTLYIVIPAYNESENIKRTIEEWCPVVEKHNGGGASRLVIINDGSRDDTYEIASAECETHPLLTVLTKPNGGHGSTVLYGYRYALENGADYIFQTDSDGQTDPEEFEKFWQIREGYDAIFGNRTSRGDGFSRAVVEKVLCAVLWTYFHVSVPDANAPFRLMKTDYVAEYLPLMPENYNLPNALLTAFGAYFHRKIRFIPIISVLGWEEKRLKFPTPQYHVPSPPAFLVLLPPFYSSVFFSIAEKERISGQVAENGMRLISSTLLINKNKNEACSIPKYANLRRTVCLPCWGVRKRVS